MKHETPLLEPGDDLSADESEFWHSVARALIAKGFAPSEAVEGANLLFQAHQRRRREAEMAPSPVSARQSGVGDIDSEPSVRKTG